MIAVLTLTAAMALVTHDPGMAQKLNTPSTYVISANTTRVHALFTEAKTMRVFKSLTDLKAAESAGTIQNLDAVTYDNEGGLTWPTPQNERAHPGVYMTRFAKYATSHHLEVILAPARSLVPHGDYVTRLLPRAVGRAFKNAGVATGIMDVPTQADQFDHVAFQAFFHQTINQAHASFPGVRAIVGVSWGRFKGTPYPWQIKQDIATIAPQVHGFWITLNGDDPIAVSRADAYLGSAL